MRKGLRIESLFIIKSVQENTDRVRFQMFFL